MYHCPECKEVLHFTEFENMWDYVSKKFKCDNCNTLLTTSLDYCYDEDTGDVEYWFEIERD